MAAFDPELYLRMLGEQELASGLDLQHEAVNGRARLSSAAAAFANAGVMDAQAAAAIALDYELADMLRAGHDGRLRHRRAWQAGDEPVVPFTARRVHVLDRTIALGDGARLLVHSLTVHDDDASLACEIYAETPLGHGPGSSPSITVRDGNGQPHTPHFSGSWGDHHAQGDFGLPHGMVDAGTEWIEVEGMKLILGDPTPSPPVEVEFYPAEGVALRYLWQLLANVGQHPGGRDVAEAIAALQVAGVVGEHDPALTAVNWVKDVQEGTRRGSFGVGPGSPATGAPPEGVPAEWRSLWSSSRPGTGPTGSIAVSAATSIFDGISVAVNVLRSSREAFTLQVETAGAPPPHNHFQSELRAPVTWWAEDDRGTWYLGHINGWSSSSGRGKGAVEFGCLDPRARELTVRVRTLNACASIPVPLDWKGPT